MTHSLTITHLGHRGDGIGLLDGQQVFVPYALPGEQVRVSGSGERVQLDAIETASPDRITPQCPHFGTCGGCLVQHWALPKALEWKRELVAIALRQADITTTLNPTLDAHGEGRRRITLHGRKERGGEWVVGFAKARSHDLVAIDHCPVLVEALHDAPAMALDLLKSLHGAMRDVDVHITATLGGLDVDLRGVEQSSEKVRLALVSCANHLKLARLTMEGALLVETRSPDLMLGEARVKLPPASFLQATEAGEATLAGLVLEQVGKAKLVADLFCGVGTFAFRLAKTVRVLAFDSDVPAIAALDAAKRQMTGLKPIAAEARDLYRRPIRGEDLKGVDMVVMDPPRSGAEAQAKMLAKSKIAKVVMVSCNPATFARDARILIDGGYHLRQVTPVDQFRHSAHVELVGVFER